MIARILAAILRMRMRQIDRQWCALNRVVDAYERALLDGRNWACTRRVALMMRRQELGAKLARLQSQTGRTEKKQLEI